MTGQWRHLPVPARPIAAATADAVTAARASDATALDAAAAALGALDQAQVGLVLGTVVRLVLEELHPDGLDGEDVRGILTTVATAAAWRPDADPRVFLFLLAGALGVHDPEEEPPRPEVVAVHAALLLAHLLGARPLSEFVDRALHEIQRTQLND